jgi:hypothetical protein
VFVIIHQVFDADRTFGWLLPGPSGGPTQRPRRTARVGDHGELGAEGSAGEERAVERLDLRDHRAALRGTRIHLGPAILKDRSGTVWVLDVVANTTPRDSVVAPRVPVNDARAGRTL